MIAPLNWGAQLDERDVVDVLGQLQQEKQIQFAQNNLNCAYKKLKKLDLLKYPTPYGYGE